MNRNIALGVFFVLGFFACLAEADGPDRPLAPIA